MDGSKELYLALRLADLMAAQMALQSEQYLVHLKVGRMVSSKAVKLENLKGLQTVHSWGLYWECCSVFVTVDTWGYWKGGYLARRWELKKDFRTETYSVAQWGCIPTIVAVGSRYT
jgi:hypothetical protein